MIRKNSRIMALFIAIQSLAFFSTIGVNAAVLKGSASQNGEINNAAAYKDGSFYIEGNIEGRGSAACYLKDGVYSNLKNVTSNIDTSSYGSKYIEIHGGDYYLDMSNGVLSSSRLKKNDINNASDKLKENLKNDNSGRYKKEELNNSRTLVELPRNKFSQGWYESRYVVNEKSTSINNGAEESTVYSDNNGNYIDADYSVGSIKVQLTNGKSAEIKNTHDKVENTRAAIAQTEVIGQDSKNIYRLAEITLKCDEVGVGIKSVNGIEVNGQNLAFRSGDNGSSVVVDVIQSLSKEAASERTGGIKYPKKVTNYVLGNNSGQNVSLLKNSSDGFTLSNGKLLNYSYSEASLQGKVIELKSNGAYSYVEEKANSSIRINKGASSIDLDADGNLWALGGKNIYKFNTNTGFEQIYELDNLYTNLSVYDNKNIVVWNKENKIYSTIGGKTVKQATENTVSENAETAESASSTVKETNNTSSNAETAENTSINTEKSEKTSTGLEIKENVSENEGDKKKEEDKENKGWVKNSSGQWNYIDGEGKNHIGWLNDNGNWYYMDSNGVMVTGWKKIDNIWYYLGQDGVMRTSWQNIDGNWYYFNTKGEMLTHTIVEGNVIGFDGKMLKL